MRLCTALRTSALFLLAISLVANCQSPIANSISVTRQSEIGNQKSAMLFTRLSGFQLNRHIRVTHALTFVGVGLAQLVHLRADLAEFLLINSRNRQRRLILLNVSFGRQTFG